MLGVKLSASRTANFAFLTNDAAIFRPITHHARPFHQPGLSEVCSLSSHVVSTFEDKSYMKRSRHFYVSTTSIYCSHITVIKFQCSWLESSVVPVHNSSLHSQSNERCDKEPCMRHYSCKTEVHSKTCTPTSHNLGHNDQSTAQPPDRSSFFVTRCVFKSSCNQFV